MSPMQRSGRGQEALLVGWKVPGALLEVWEAQSKVREGSQGPLEGPGWVRRPTHRSG